MCFTTVAVVLNVINRRSKTAAPHRNKEGEASNNHTASRQWCHSYIYNNDFKLQIPRAKHMKLWDARIPHS